MKEQQESKALQLRERSTALIATLTDPDKAREFERSLTLAKVLESAIPISVLKASVGFREIAQALDVQLTKLVANVNVSQNLNDSQIKTVVEDLLDKYPNETIEDFILVFKRARQGEFGTIYHLHSAVIFSWMEFYLNEKYEALEKKLEREKDVPYVEPSGDTGPGYKAFLEYQKKLVEEAKGAIRPITEQETKAEGQEKPIKPVYFRPTEAEVRAHEKHIRYLKANYNSRTREKLPNWTEENLWNELND